MATDVHELGIHVQFLCDGPDCFSSHRSLLLDENQCFRSLILLQKLVSYIRGNNDFVCQHTLLSHYQLHCIYIHTHIHDLFGNDGNF